MKAGRVTGLFTTTNSSTSLPASLCFTPDALCTGTEHRRVHANNMLAFDVNLRMQILPLWK